MVTDARRLEPLAQEAADLISVLAQPDRLIICCDLISGEQSVASLLERLTMEEPDLLDALKALNAEKVLDMRTDDDGAAYYRLADIQAAEIVDAVCSAFLGEDFSNRAKIPFRANKRLVGGHGKFGGANI